MCMNENISELACFIGGSVKVLCLSLQWCSEIEELSNSIGGLVMLIQ